MYELYESEIVFSLVDENEDFYEKEVEFVKSIWSEREQNVLLVSLCTDERFLFQLLPKKKTKKNRSYCNDLNGQQPTLTANSEHQHCFRSEKDLFYSTNSSSQATEKISSKPLRSTSFNSSSNTFLRSVSSTLDWNLCSSFVSHLRYGSVSDFCFTSNGNELLLLLNSGCLIVIPIVNILTSCIQLHDLYSDGRLVCSQVSLSPTALISYNSPEYGKEIVAIGSADGTVCFVTKDEGTCLGKTSIDRHVKSFEILRDKFAITLIVTSIDCAQWRLVLEENRAATACSGFSVGSTPIEEKDGLFMDDYKDNLLGCFPATVAAENGRNFEAKPTPLHTPPPNPTSSGSSSTNNNNTNNTTTTTTTNTTTIKPSNDSLESNSTGSSPKSNRLKCFLLYQHPYILSLLGEQQEQLVNLNVFEFSTFKYQSIAPLSRYIFPKVCFNLERPLLLLTDRFIVSVCDHTLYVISKQCSDSRRQIYENSIICQLNFPDSILALFKSNGDSIAIEQSQNNFLASTAAVDNDEERLDHFLVVTRTQMYECRPRTTCERLFIEMLGRTQHQLVSNTTTTRNRSNDKRRCVSSKDSRNFSTSNHQISSNSINDFTHPERFLFMLRLNLNVYYERAAIHFLGQRQFGRALQFFCLAKTPKLERLLHFIGNGFLSESISLIEETLNERCSELDPNERLHFSTLLVQCLVQRILEKHLTQEKQRLIERLHRFLSQDLFYDAVTCIRLFVKCQLFELAECVAVARNHFTQLLQCLLEANELQSHLYLPETLEAIGTSSFKFCLEAEDQQEAYLRCLLQPQLLNALLVRPSLIASFLRLLIESLPKLSPSLLMQAATTFDPRRQLVKLLLNRVIPQLNRMYLSADVPLTPVPSTPNANTTTTSSDNAEEEQVQKRDVLNFFLFVAFILLRFNKSSNSGTVFDQRLLSLCSTDLTKNRQSTSYSSSHRSQTQFRKWISSFPKLSLSAGQVNSFLVRDGELLSWGESQPLLVSSLHHRNASTAINRCSKIPSWNYSSSSCASSPRLVNFFSSNLGVKVLSISTGARHSIAITDHGCFGLGVSTLGQLGCGPKLKVASQPMLIERLSRCLITAVSCGQYHSLAIDHHGRLYSWGWGVHGQLGHGSTDNEYWPRLVAAMKHKIVKAVCGGYCHSVALDKDGVVYSFGSGLFGQLGNASVTKQSIPQPICCLPEPIVSISSHYFHCVAVTRSRKRLYTWGCNPQNLQLKAQGLRRERLQRTTSTTGQSMPGKGVSMYDLDHMTPRAIEVDFVDGLVRKCETGSLHSLLLTETGRVYSWGRGPDGQMGHDCRKELTEPFMIMKLVGERIVDIGCGFDFSLAVSDKGELFAWGQNASAQLGLQTRSESPSTDHSPPITLPNSMEQKRMRTKLNRRVFSYVGNARIEMFPAQVTLPSSHSVDDDGNDLLDSLNPDHNSLTSDHCNGSLEDRFDCLDDFGSSSSIDSTQFAGISFPIDVYQLARLICIYRQDLDLQLLLNSALSFSNHQIAGFVCDLLNLPVLSLRYYLKALMTETGVTSSEQSYSDQFERNLQILLAHHFKDLMGRNQALVDSLLCQLLNEWKEQRLCFLTLERVLLRLYEQDVHHFMFGVSFFQLFTQTNSHLFSTGFKLRLTKQTLQYIQQTNLTELMCEPVLQLLTPVAAETSTITNNTITSSSSNHSFGSLDSVRNGTNVRDSNEEIDDVHLQSAEQAWKHILRSIQNNCNGTGNWISSSSAVAPSSSLVTSSIGSNGFVVGSTSNTVSPPEASSAGSVLAAEPNNSVETDQSEPCEAVHLQPNDSEMFVYSCHHQFGSDFFHKVLLRQMQQHADQIESCNENDTQDLLSTNSDSRQSSAGGTKKSSTLWLQRFSRSGNDLLTTNKCPLCVVGEQL